MTTLDSAAGPFKQLHVALVAAHADDEVIGAGGQFAGLRRLSLIHVTDGVPSRRDARAHGFPTRAAYREARRCEVVRSLQISGVNAEHIELGFRDQQVAFDLVSLTDRLADLFGSLRPDVVVTHPYEGGHPDHDAVAFAAAAAIAVLGARLPLWEMTSYHAGEKGIVRGDFLPYPDRAVTTVLLTEAEQVMKRQMLLCFQTQQHILEHFPLGVERFRLAPPYEFTAPPQARLLFANRRRAWTGEHWRRLSAAALRRLERPRSEWRPHSWGAFRRLRAAAWALWIAPM